MAFYLTISDYIQLFAMHCTLSLHDVVFQIILVESAEHESIKRSTEGDTSKNRKYIYHVECF